MAYRRSGGTRSRSRSRSTAGYTRRRAPRAGTRARRSVSRRSSSGRQQTVKLVIETTGATPVARPTSYLGLNPALVQAGLPKKAKL